MPRSILDYHDRLFELLDAAEVLLVALDVDGRVVELNPHACGLLGRSCEELAGEIWVDVCVPEDQRAEVRRAFEGAVRGRFPAFYENAIVTRDGRTRLLVWTNATVTDEDAGKVVGTVSLGFDVTDHRRTERAQRQREGALAAAVDSMVDAVVTIGADGRIRSANRATTEMFGRAVEALIGRDLGALMPGPHRGKHREYIERYLREGDPRVIGRRTEVEGQRADGSVFPLEIAVTEVGENDERIFTGVMHDISDRRRAEAAEDRLRELQFHHTELERLAVAGEMAAIAAHEIRSPLNALAINVQMAERALRRNDAAARDKALDLLGSLKGEIQRINVLLEDYLNVIRQPRDLPTHEFPVNRVVGDAVDFIKPLAAARRVQVVLRVDLEVGDVPGHEAKLRQVVLNLLLNAVQAMPGGGVVRVSTAASGGDICISVEDDGPGIAESELERIFKPFVTTKEVGTGLGLAICERIVKQMGGTIVVQSEVGHGARFDVLLPAASEGQSE